MTPEQAKKYLQERGATCPQCDSSIEGGSMEFDSGTINQKIHCTNSECDAKWWDVYTLTGVADIKTGEIILSTSSDASLGDELPRFMRAVRALMDDLSLHVQTSRFRPSLSTKAILRRVNFSYKKLEDAGVQIDS